MITQEIKHTLLKNEFIAKEVKSVELFSFPDTEKLTGAYIIINAVTPPQPTDYADATWTAIEQLVQINVWCGYDKGGSVEIIADKIRDILWSEYRYIQDDGAPLEYDKSTGIYNEARRYRCKKTII